MTFYFASLFGESWRGGSFKIYKDDNIVTFSFLSFIIIISCDLIGPS